MNTFTIQVKRWDGTTSDDVPALGEIVYRTDSNELYIGDGDTIISELQPFAKVGMLDTENGDVITMINNAIASKQNKITSGTSTPSSTGNDGDVYIQYN